MKVVVLGGSGMLGIGVLRALVETGIKDLVYTTRDGSVVREFPNIQVRKFDANTADFALVESEVESGSYIINCIGVIKPHIKDDNPAQRLNALKINGLFPDNLAAFASERGARVIQIATDCVYSGNKGRYDESDLFDATDVYGKTKSLGEVPSDSMMHLRVSIIGPESGRSTSLFEWVRNQPDNAQINGFTDHEWNGVTTYHFGKICAGIIQNNLFTPGVQHIIPGSIVSKYELVTQLALRASRSDIQVAPKPSGHRIDRTLSTNNPEMNKAIWSAAGYQNPPTVQQMIAEMPI